MSYVYEHPKLKLRSKQVAIRDRVAYLASKQGHVVRHNYDVGKTSYTGVCRLCGARFVVDLANEAISLILPCTKGGRTRLRRI